MSRGADSSEAHAETLAVGSGAAGGPTLVAGALLAGRYRIVRFVARGGMGEVYEAEDHELGGRVAVKTIRPDIAADPGAIERFRQEIATARRVTHPHVCRIFDVETEAGPPPLVFLSMELLAGQTLAERLRLRGRLEHAEVAVLARQIAAGLDAAHEAGVVHRDFKSANVMLVSDSSRGVRAVVTDFGLAIARGEPSRLGQARAEDEAGLMVGTPAYMAPEQVEGGEVGPAADVYAFGVVLFELLTGRLPFEGDSAMGVAVARLRADAPSVRKVVSGLDRRWERVIARCLARAPKDRFPTAGAAVADLLDRPARWRRGWMIAGAVAVAALGSGTAVWWRARASLPAAVGPVAVLGFRGDVGTPRWLDTAVAEVVSNELERGELHVVPADELSRARLDVGIDSRTAPTPTQLLGLRRRLGIGSVVTGAYAGEAGGRVRLSVEVVDAATGRARTRIERRGSVAEILGEVARDGGELRRALGARGDASAVAARLPSDPEAVRLYAEGLDALRAREVQAARGHLEAAVARTPDFALAHVALADTLEVLRDQRAALAHAERAFELAKALPRLDRLRIEAVYRLQRAETARAADILRTLFELHPDEPAYGLRLVDLLCSRGRADDAERTLLELRAAPGGREDPRVDLAESLLARALWSYDRAQRAAARAAMLARTHGWRTLEAEAKLSQGMSLAAGGRPAEALQPLAEARDTFKQMGLPQLELTALRQLGTAHVDSGDFDRGEKLQGEVVELEGKLGEASARSQLYRMGTLVRRGRPGDLAAAAEIMSELEARHAGDAYGLALARIYLSQVRVEGGRAAEALELATSARRAFEKLSNQRMRAFARVVAADALLVQGDVRGARRELEEARQEREALGLRVPTAAVDAQLAEIDLKEGRGAEALGRARRAAAALGGDGTLGSGIAVRGVLLAALVSQGELAEAERVLEQMGPPCKGTGEADLRLTCAAASARVEARQGRAAPAIARLEAVVRDARAAGLLRSALELELLLAEIDRAGARGRRVRLAAEADRLGFEGIAARARRR